MLSDKTWVTYVQPAVIDVSPKNGGSGLDSLWDHPKTPRSLPKPMTTTNQYADHVESIAASLQYIAL